MELTEIPKVNKIPKRCIDCIFEIEDYDEDAMWGSGYTYDCNLKHWLSDKLCSWDSGISNCPCPLDGKVKSHHEGR